MQAASEPEQGAAGFRQAIELAPEDAEAHHHLGVVLQEQGEFARSADPLHSALALRPNFPEALCNLAMTLAIRKK